jgi:Uma2 family endonuclease
MSTTVSPPGKKLMTAEEFLEIPEDGIYRELIRGEIRQFGMMMRNHVHSGVEAKVVYLLMLWLERQPLPRGKVGSGECGFRLRRDPDVLVGVDVALASAELVSRTDRTMSYYDGPPLLAVEILSPSDKHEDIVEKIRLYLDAGVVVWEIDPDFRRVSVHRPGHEPEMLNASQELSADPYLPGFRVAVAAIFQD